jgi:hypothetical protein
VEFELNWKKDTLFGYEESVHFLLVESIRERIREGDKIRPFSVFNIGDNSYILSYNPRSPNNGGHHRAIAYYKEKKNPIVNLLEPKFKGFIDFIKSSSLSLSSIDLFDYRKIPSKEIREYYEEQFWRRAIRYPRFNPKKYGLEFPSRLEFMVPDIFSKLSS